MPRQSAVGRTRGTETRGDLNQNSYGAWCLRCTRAIRNDGHTALPTWRGAQRGVATSIPCTSCTTQTLAPKHCNSIPGCRMVRHYSIIPGWGSAEQGLLVRHCNSHPVWGSVQHCNRLPVWGSAEQGLPVRHCNSLPGWESVRHCNSLPGWVWHCNSLSGWIGTPLQ